MSDEFVDVQAIANARKAIAIHALNAGVGGRLITNIQLAETYGIVAGTVQRALKNLNDSGAIITVSRGHQGRVIKELDVGLCWNLAKLPAVQLLMPHSGSIEVDSLVEVITKKLGGLNIPYFITQLSGGDSRLKAVLSEEYDLAITSSGIFISHKDDIQEEFYKVLNPGTYYAFNKLVVVNHKGQDSSSLKRVALDKSSQDHVRLTKREFPESEGYTYINTQYRHIPAKILSGEIDVGIWHMTSSPIPLTKAGLEARFLVRKETQDLHNDISAGAILANPGRIELSSLLHMLNVDSFDHQLNENIKSEDPFSVPFIL
ncbi:hypothetical protein PEC301937_03990 [Pectobacterium carotovorum subsp. carotovorum]|nr:hypothetical protein EGD00_08055 [Pectobacterium carotovorum subsp. carotovorum]GKW14449.1 hypothetical protein PEC301937_03990 [Pectobacterium carotovorum subsp. carotovorum]